MIRVRHLLVPVASVASFVVVSLLLAGRLPDPVASHFGAGGVPDGSADLGVLTALLAVTAAAVAAGSLTAVRTAPDRNMARTLVAVAHGLPAGLAVLHATLLVRQLDLVTWTDAVVPAGTVVPALLVPGLLAGVLGWVVAADLTVVEADRRLPVDEVEVAPGEAVVWTGRAGAAWGPVAGGVLVLLAVGVQLAGGDTVAAAVILFVGLLVAVVGRARVTAGPGGLTVRGGVLPVWPRVRVPLDDITTVRVEDVATLTYGGIGYRVRPGVRAIVTWPGEALRVDRRDGPSLVVTVGGARTAAGVLLAHLQQHQDRVG